MEQLKILKYIIIFIIRKHDFTNFEKMSVMNYSCLSCELFLSFCYLESIYIYIYIYNLFYHKRDAGMAVLI